MRRDPMPAYYRIFQGPARAHRHGSSSTGHPVADRRRDHGRVRREPAHRALGGGRARWRRGGWSKRFPGRGTFVLESDPAAPTGARGRSRICRSTIPTRASSFTA